MGTFHQLITILFSVLVLTQLGPIGGAPRTSADR